MRGLLFLLVILAALGVAGDTALRSYAENRAADAVDARLDLGAESDVSFEGWPFVLHAVRGRFPSATVGADNAGRGPVRLSRVELVFRRVTFEPAELIRGDASSLSFRDGTGTATITDERLTRALRAAGAPVSVTIDGGVVEVSNEQVGSVPGEIALEGASLVVSAPEPNGPVRLDLPSLDLPSLDLPSLGEGIEYESLDLRGGEAVLTLSLSDEALSDL